MADFRILRPIYLNGSVYKPGQEKLLAKAGLSDSDVKAYVKRGDLRDTSKKNGGPKKEAAE